MSTITQILMKWYDRGRRDLPWRRTRNPYEIWVSEIILQQTRVDQGLPYYTRFLRRFPDIASLADAPADEVLRIWQGLGYYSRARNMMTAAKQVMDQYGGHFPAAYSGILGLKGIGPYTSAAIASICFGEAVPVVDGNVVRFLARLFGITEPANSAAVRDRIRSMAGGLMDPERPGDFNQAMMEFGALVCTPRNPGCPACILKKRCMAYRAGTVGSIPAMPKAKKPAERYFNYIVASRKRGSGEAVFIRKREEDDIWKGLYEFPMIETHRSVSAAGLARTDAWKMLFGESEPLVTSAGKTVKHILSHQVIRARFIEAVVKRPPQGGFHSVPVKELSGYPFPKLIVNFLSRRNKGKLRD